MGPSSLEVREKGFESYPAPPPGSVSAAYADLAYSMGVDIPDGFIVVGELDDVTPEMLELRDRFVQEPSRFKKVTNKLLSFFD